MAHLDERSSVEIGPLQSLADVPDEQIKRWGIIALIGFGVLLVAFANSLGVMMASGVHTAGGEHSWIPADADRSAVTFRTLGLMAFAAGLVSQIVQAIRTHSKKS